MSKDKKYTNQEIIDGLKSHDKEVIEHIYLLFYETSKRYFNKRMNISMNDDDFSSLISDCIISLIITLQNQTNPRLESQLSENGVINFLLKIFLRRRLSEREKNIYTQQANEIELNSYESNIDDIISPNSTEFDFVNYSDNATLLFNAINKLDEISRYIISARFIEKKSIEEIASKFKMTEGALRLKLNRSLFDLREIIKSNPMEKEVTNG